MLLDETGNIIFTIVAASVGPFVVIEDITVISNLLCPMSRFRLLPCILIINFVSEKFRNYASINLFHV